MSTKTPIIVLLVLCSLPLLAGCSGESDKKEKSRIEQKTEKAAQQAVERIKAPLDQAKTAAGLEENQGRQLQEQERK